MKKIVLLVLLIIWVLIVSGCSTVPEKQSVNVPEKQHINVPIKDRASLMEIANNAPNGTESNCSKILSYDYEQVKPGDKNEQLIRSYNKLMLDLKISCIRERSYRPYTSTQYVPSRPLSTPSRHYNHQRFQMENRYWINRRK